MTARPSTCGEQRDETVSAALQDYSSGRHTAYPCAGLARCHSSARLSSAPMPPPHIERACNGPSPPCCPAALLCGAPAAVPAMFTHSLHLHRPLPSVGLAQKRHLQLDINQLKGCVLAHWRHKHPASRVEGLEKDRVASTGDPQLALCRCNLCTSTALAGWHPFAGIAQNRQASWAGGAQNKPMLPPELLADARP